MHKNDCFCRRTWDKVQTWRFSHCSLRPTVWTQLNPTLMLRAVLFMSKRCQLVGRMRLGPNHLDLILMPGNTVTKYYFGSLEFSAVPENQISTEDLRLKWKWLMGSRTGARKVGSVSVGLGWGSSDTLLEIQPLKENTRIAYVQSQPGHKRYKYQTRTVFFCGAHII